jgi:hypothetical protein
VLLASCPARVSAIASESPEALARGERIHLVCHEDVLVIFRKPEAAEPARIETVAGTGRAAA